MGRTPGSSPTTPLWLALAAAVLLTLATFAALPIRGDLASLLPAGRTEPARLLLGTLRAGPAADLVLAAIDSAPPATLAALSTRLRAILATIPGVAFAANGQSLLTEADLATLNTHRYLLAPTPHARDFTPDALRVDLAALLAGLRSSASPVVARYGLPDPTGALPDTLAALTPAGSSPRTLHGVWFAPTAPRALLALRLEGPALDAAAQGSTLRAIHAAFAQARAATQGAASSRLRLEGPAVFATTVAAGIRADVRRLSILSTLAVAALLIWRFRSPAVLAAIAIPTLLAAATAALATAALFGFVHGIALGFGLTMLGVAVDYPVLLIGHRKQAEPPAGTLARIGPTFALSVATATLGLSGLAFGGDGAVAQLGVFGMVGLPTAAAITAIALPPLVARAGLAPVAAGDPRLLRRVERWRRFRPAAPILAAAAALILLATGGPRLQHDLAALTPVPPADLALYDSLRVDLGAPDTAALVALQAPTAQQVLEREEALAPTLLAHTRAITSAAQILPSAALQRARQAALPSPAVLNAALAAAQAAPPADTAAAFTRNAFDAFTAAIEAARTQHPLIPETLHSPALAARLAPLLSRQPGQPTAWLGLITLTPPTNFPALRAALASAPAATLGGATLIDIRRETDALVTDATARAWPLLAAGALASIAAMLASLRSPARVARIAAAIGGALLVTLALLTLAGTSLALPQIAALQFVVGVGLDYALFFARTQIDEEERARTLRTLTTCFAMALLSFGALALCETPLLRAIGTTTATGITCGMLFAFLGGPDTRSEGAEKGSKG